jgi:hypothetical protein
MILENYGYELQMEVVAEQKKKSKIDIKPTPTNLLTPTALPPGAPGAGAPATKGAQPKGL